MMIHASTFAKNLAVFLIVDPVVRNTLSTEVPLAPLEVVAMVGTSCSRTEILRMA